MKLFTAMAVAVATWAFGLALPSRAQSTSAEPPLYTFTRPATPDPAADKIFCDSSRLQLAADGLADKGKWQEAEVDYQKALRVWPQNPCAIYGLGRCADAAGDTQTALEYYRRAVYETGQSNGLPQEGAPDGVVITGQPDGIVETDQAKLARFAVLLCKTGQYQEALVIYRHAIKPDYEINNSGKMVEEVRPPDFVHGSWALTPKRLEAMAYVVLGMHTKDVDQAQPDYRQAVRLAPDSSVAHYYLVDRERDREKARPDMELAVKLDDGTNAAVIQRQYYLRYQAGRPGDPGPYATAQVATKNP